KHLALAVLTDPTHAKARGLLGLVDRVGRWRNPEAVSEQARADEMRSEYVARRARTPETADAQWRLALWCDEHGLKNESRAHLTMVTALDPRREAAWTRLCYQRHGGRWMTRAQIADEKADADAQRRADRRWKKELEQWK